MSTAKHAGTGSVSPVAAFDRLHSEKNKKILERWTVGLSVVGFVVHLTCIFLARNLPHSPAMFALAGNNYISAIETPFSFILFYEVLILILALPQSTTRSIATQFEIVSLIFIRGFFKDMGTLDLENFHSPSPGLILPFVEICAGLFMFLLVTIFQDATRRSPRQSPGSAAGHRTFVERKKLIAMVLTVLFVVLAAMHLSNDALRIYGEVYHGATMVLGSTATFYSDVFTVMIFTDVLILILSLFVSDRYELVFRNAAFVISTILIRFSLTTSQPYGALLGVFGMLFAIGTILIYNYSTRTRMSRDEVHGVY